MSGSGCTTGRSRSAIASLLFCGIAAGFSVYLVARKKYRHPVAWILAVDMKDGKVQAVLEFGTLRELDLPIIYHQSIISKYMMTLPTTPGCSFPISSTETHQEQLDVGLKPSGYNAEESE
ncbi:unnamed protein product [Urochloa humidicola]